MHCWAAQERLYSGKHTSSCSSDLSTNRDDVRRRRSLEEPGFLKMEAQGQGQAACFFCPASRLVDGFYILSKATAFRYAKPKRGSVLKNSHQKKSIHILPCQTNSILRLQHPFKVTRGLTFSIGTKFTALMKLYCQGPEF